MTVRFAQVDFVVVPTSLLLALAMGSGLDIRGSTSCPSAAEVSERLRPMLPSEAAFPSGAFVELGDVPARVSGLLDVEVRLRGATGEGGATSNPPLVVRRVERSGGCSETTDVVAVIAASWAGRYPTSPPVVPKEMSLDGPTATSATAPVTIARAARPASPSATRFSIGALAGVVAAPAGGSAPLVGAEVEARRERWGLRLTAAGIGERAVDFAPGTAAWRRLLVLSSVSFSWGSPRLFAEASAGALVGLTQTRGQGFAANGDDLGLDLGVAPGFRVGARLAAAPVTVWVGATGLAWLRPHRVSVAGSAAQLSLPVLDGWTGGGLSFPLGS